MFANGINKNKTRIAKDVNTMEIITWMIAGILLINVIRLCLAIKQHNKIDHLNRNSDAQMQAWNQMCRDILTWVDEVNNGCNTDTEAGKAD